MAWAGTQSDMWVRLDEEAAYVSAWVGLAELALGGCTLTTDDLYAHPRPKLIDAEIAAARDVGFRFDPCRGGVALGRDDGLIFPRRARAGPRHDHGRHRAADPDLSRPLARLDAADRRRAVGQLGRDARADGGGGRARRAARRADDDAPLAVRGRGGVVARLLRDAAGRLARERRLGHVARVGRALHLRHRRRDRPARALRRRRRALPDDVLPRRRRRHAGRGDAPRGRQRRARLRRRRVGARLDVARGAHRAPARPLPPRADVDERARRARAGDARLGALPRPRVAQRLPRAGRVRRRRRVAARRRRVRGRVDRSGRGVAPLRAGERAAHRHRRQAGRARRRAAAAEASTRCWRGTPRSRASGREPCSERPADPRRRAARDDDGRRAPRRLGRDLGRHDRRRRRRGQRARGGRDAERAQLPRHAGADQHAPPHVPEPDARVRARPRARAARVGGRARRDVDPHGRGGVVRLDVDRPRGARARRLHADDRRHVRASAAEPDRRADRRGPGLRLALRPVPRRRRARPRGRRDLPARARPGRRRDPRRHGAPDHDLSRPLARLDDPDRLRPVRRRRRDAGADGGRGGARREARRPHDDAPVAASRARRPGRSRGSG